MSSVPERPSPLPSSACETEPMRILVAMSGGVDSSVAAARCVDQYGVDAVAGATLKLWGGESDSGCCSVADVDDARRVADHLGIVHHVFNFADDFDRHVVDPYVAGHAAGRTPNPCIECNRHLKFDRLLERAVALGFDAVATGHHARCERDDNGRYRLRRGADGAKDQSYVLSMLGQDQLARTLLPLGNSQKADVRQEAADRGLRTAAKPDSQDVCFIRSDTGRAGFLARRIPLHPGRLVDHATGDELGTVEAVELVTVGQRRGMGHADDGRRRFVTSVDIPGRTVSLGPAEAVLCDHAVLSTVTWVDAPVFEAATGEAATGEAQPETPVLVQCSAHGPALEATVAVVGPEGDHLRVTFAAPQRRVAPGQTIALYDPERPDDVVGAGVVV